MYKIVVGTQTNQTRNATSLQIQRLVSNNPDSAA
jgi:hypothetical protein